MDNRLMTPEQLAAIRARAEAATAGPWIGTTDPSHFDADCVDSSEWSMYVERRCDRDFIAHARADIPALLDEVRRLQGSIDSACDKLDGVVGNVFSVGERVVRLDHLASTAHAMWAEQDGAESEGG